MTKKTGTPADSWIVYGPQPVVRCVPYAVVTWLPTTASAASARNESKSGKRGFPGGGCSAGDGAVDALRACGTRGTYQPRSQARTCHAARVADLAPELAAELAEGPAWMYGWTLGVEVPLGHPELLEVHRTRAEMIEPTVRAALADAGSDSRALDLGCSEGWFSHQLLHWGASSVLGVDVRDVNVRRARLVARHFGIPQTRLTFRAGDVFDLDPGELGTFDVVLALGLVYHLEDPVGMLRLARALTHSVCIVESQLTQQREPVVYGWGSTGSQLEAEASFAAILERDADVQPSASRAGVLSLIPNRAALGLMLEAAGFDELEWLAAGTTHNAQYRGGDRAIAVARVSA